jgi:hypothetical protein
VEPRWPQTESDVANAAGADTQVIAVNLRACFEIQEVAFAGRKRRNMSNVVAK